MEITKSEVARRIGTADGGVERLIRAGMLRVTSSGAGRRLRYAFDESEVNAIKSRMNATGKRTPLRQINAIVAEMTPKVQKPKASTNGKTNGHSVDFSDMSIMDRLDAIEHKVDKLLRAWGMVS